MCEADQRFRFHFCQRSTINGCRSESVTEHEILEKALSKNTHCFNRKSPFVRSIPCPKCTHGLARQRLNMSSNLSPKWKCRLRVPSKVYPDVEMRCVGPRAFYVKWVICTEAESEYRCYLPSRPKVSCVYQSTYRGYGKRRRGGSSARPDTKHNLATSCIH